MKPKNLMRPIHQTAHDLKIAQREIGQVVESEVRVRRNAA